MADDCPPDMLRAVLTPVRLLAADIAEKQRTRATQVSCQMQTAAVLQTNPQAGALEGYDSPGFLMVSGMGLLRCVPSRRAGDGSGSAAGPVCGRVRLLGRSTADDESTATRSTSVPRASRPRHPTSAVALILCRGGSRGIPKKNIKLLNGVPLLAYTVTAALQAKVFQRVVVSTDAEDIAAVAEQYGAEVFWRSAASAADTASSESAIADFLDRGCSHNARDAGDGQSTPALSSSSTAPPAIVCLVQATSPLTTAADLRGGMQQFVAYGEATGLVSAVRMHRFFWKIDEVVAGKEQDGDGVLVGSAKNYDPVKRPRRQDWDGEIMENGCFYVFRTEDFRASGSRLRSAAKNVLFLMPEDTATELDSLVDWVIMEALVRERIKEHGVGEAGNQVAIGPNP
eukprot:g888.t1